MVTFRDLRQRFMRYATDSVSDVFRVRISNSDNLLVGRGKNSIMPVRFGKTGTRIVVGTNSADFANSYDLYQVVQSFFHELRHVEHRAEAYRGCGFNNDISCLTIEYLACANDPIRYKKMYGYTLFETDANLMSIKPAIAFCSEIMPGVDFEKIAFKTWCERCDKASVPFVEDWENCSNLDELLCGMKNHMMVCGNVLPMRPSYSVDFDGNLVADGSLLYLKEHASKDLCDMWKNAVDNGVRNCISAAMLVVLNPVVAKRICPDVEEYDIFVSDMNVSDLVRDCRFAVVTNTEVDFWSEHDMLGDLRTQLASGKLEVRTPNDSLGDRLFLSENGLAINHTSFDYVGNRYEFLSFDDNEYTVLQRVFHEMSEKHLEVVRGDVSVAFLERFDSYQQKMQVLQQASDTCMNDLVFKSDVNVSFE